MNGFSKYKNSIDNILENSFDNKDTFKKNLSVIMGAMKYSKTLREFFTLYNDIELKEFKTIEDSKSYLLEAITYLKDNKDKLDEVKPILDKIIYDRKELCNESENLTYNNIDDIVFNNSVSNLEKIASSRKSLTESMVGVKKVLIESTVDPKILSYVISKNYSKEFDSLLTESEKGILKNTILMTEDVVVTEFNNVKEIAVNKINSLLGESKDETLSAKLVEVKNEISTLESSKMSYIRVRGLLEDLN
jgi:hypothetical protein